MLNVSITQTSTGDLIETLPPNEGTENLDSIKGVPQSLEILHVGLVESF